MVFFKADFDFRVAFVFGFMAIGNVKEACNTLGEFYNKNAFIMMEYVDRDNKEYKKYRSWK